MLNAEELAELRALQARAYGREVGVTGPEAARLRMLERQRVDGTTNVGPGPHDGTSARRADAARHENPGATPQLSAAEPRSIGEPSAAEPAHTRTVPVDALTDHADPESSADSADAEARRPPAASVRDSLRALWRPVVVAGAIVLLVGVGLGWVLFGQQRGHSIELTAQQQEWQNAIVEEGTYDPGSLRALAELDGVVTWLARMDDGRLACLIMSAGERPAPFCSGIETVQDQGLFGNYTIEAGESRTDISAQVLLTDSGEPAIRLNSFTMTPEASGMVYATEEETEIAESLAEQGFDPYTISVLGYDGDVPIWTASREDSPATCLIYGGSEPELRSVCEDYAVLTSRSEGLTMTLADAATGALTEIELHFPSSAPQYLVISKNGTGE